MQACMVQYCLHTSSGEYNQWHKYVNSSEKYALGSIPCMLLHCIMLKQLAVV